MANLAFENAFVQFGRSLSPAERIGFEQTTPSEVEAAISLISQRKDGSRLKKKMETFLKSMEQFVKIIEMVAQDDARFIAYIWGPVKYILQTSISSAHLDAYISAMAQLGNELPQLDRYEKLFIGNAEIQRLLALVYTDILEIHRRAMKDFKESVWMHVFYKGGSKFSKEFGNTIQSLRQSRSLLDNEVRLLEIERSQRSRERQEYQFQLAREEERRRQAFTVIEKIRAASSDTDQWKSANRWKGNPSCGQWLLEHEIMQPWLQGDKGSKVLWLKGNPGKTILASRVVAELKDTLNRKVLFFYFRKDDTLRDSLTAMLRGLLAQLVRLSPDIVPYIYGEVSASIEQVFASSETLMMLLENTMVTTGELWLVLDGLDECERKERKKILSWISVITSDTWTAGLQVFITSQDKQDLQHALSPLSTSACISLQESGHQDDIRTYVLRKAAKRKKQFNLSVEVEEDVVHKVTRNANGIFLFARLVSDHLKNQETPEELQNELASSRFPSDLDDIVRRLFPNQDVTEADADKTYPGETNRCFVESLMKMQRTRHLSESENNDTLKPRKIQKGCDTCQLLSFEASHLKIPLTKLMFSSIFCQVCHTLCQAVILLEEDWLKVRHGSSILDIEKGSGMLCFQVRATEAGHELPIDRTKSRWGFPMIMHIFSKHELEGAWSSLSIHQTISSHSGSDECVEKIREWLNACENDHISCSKQSRHLKQVTEGNLIASRVIDLGTEEQITPRLISTETLHISRWATLSYCWGGVSSFTTTEANLKERQQPIPWSTIPATFQDAMTLTHRLNIRYIWIDAVCIIQDSVEDWRAEASKMGSIYQDAYVVIAADLAVSCNKGIFAPRERYSHSIDIDLGHSERSYVKQQVHIEKGSSMDYTSQQSELNEWHTGSFLRHNVLESNNRTLNKRWTNPTLRRAWCFQERMLATRIIHFTAAELIWECKTKIDCECGLRKSSGSTLKQSLDTSLEKAAAVDYPAFTNSRATASKMWWKLVVEYSWCDLTVLSDKLPAISGLARLFPQLGRYWAGMWSHELPLSLLWREESYDDPGVPEPRLNEAYVAPSWSWASAICPIQEPDLNPTEAISEVVNVNDTPAAADIYGQILDARLVLKGLVLNGMIRYMSNSFFGKFITQIQLLSEDGRTVPGMGYEGAKVSFQGDYRLRQSGQNSDISTQKVLCLAIKSTSSPEHGRVLDCIVLRPSTTEVGLYERVGLVTCMESLVESERVFRKMEEVMII